MLPDLSPYTLEGPFTQVEVATPVTFVKVEQPDIPVNAAILSVLRLITRTLLSE
jgi:hypothetical protein